MLQDLSPDRDMTVPDDVPFDGTEFGEGIDEEHIEAIKQLLAAVNVEGYLDANPLYPGEIEYREPARTLELLMDRLGDEDFEITDNRYNVMHRFVRPRVKPDCDPAQTAAARLGIIGFSVEPCTITLYLSTGGSYWVAYE